MVDGKKMSEFIYTVSVCSLYLALGLFGMTLIKFGHESINGVKIPVLGVVSLKLIIGMFFYAISFLVFVFFVSKMRIAVVVPIISGLHCALTAVIGILIFKERITVWQIIGIVMIVVGTLLVGMLKK